MKKKYLIYGFAAVVTAAAVLTACGDGSDEISKILQEESKVITGEPLLSEAETAIRELELRYSKGEFTAEDYLALGQLYQEQGMVRKQRDLLEQSYRLLGDTQAFEQLQTISVNLAEETPAIQEEASLMLQNLQLEEYLDESINLVSSDEWLDTMMPKLYEGKRSYFMQQDGETVLTVEAGYDQSGAPDTSIWHHGAEQVTVLQRTGKTVQFLRTAMTDGVYQGAFEAWICDGGSGDIYHEQGTFTNGMLTGDFTVSVHKGTEGSDLFSLWSNRTGMEYTVYNGNFNEQGMTTLEQPPEKSLQAMVGDTGYSTCIVYAYNEAKNDGLFMGLAEGTDTASFVFGAESMGWKAYPEITVYEPKVTDGENGAADSDETGNGESDGAADGAAGLPDADSTGKTENIPQVRIFDGEIQLYLGGAWVSMGSVKQYEKEDPFQVYEETKQNAPSADTGAENGQQAQAGERMTGSIKNTEETPKTNTPKPSNKKNPGTTKPVTEPTPEPTPEPEPTPSPSPAPSPAPTPEPSPAPNPGGDVDIEWTPDIM